MKQMLLDIKSKHWNKHKKEVIAAAYQAMIYHTWKARNWKTFQQRIFKEEDVLRQIKKELVHRIEMLNSSKQAYSSRVFIKRLLCIYNDTCKQVIVETLLLMLLLRGRAFFRCIDWIVNDTFTWLPKKCTHPNDCDCDRSYEYLEVPKKKFTDIFKDCQCTIPKIHEWY